MGLSRVLNSRIWFGWSLDTERDCHESYAAARRAVEIDDRDSYCHYILAWACMPVGRQEEAVAEAQKSIDLTPNFALAYFALGVTRLFVGRFDHVADPFKRAMRLSPHEPLTFHFANFLALAQYHQGNYDEAVRIAQSGITLRPFHTLYRTLAAAHGQLGQREKAAAALAEVKRLTPPAAVQHWQRLYPYLDPAHREQFLDGLRKAGLEVAAIAPLPDTV